MSILLRNKYYYDIYRILKYFLLVKKHLQTFTMTRFQKTSKHLYLWTDDIAKL